MATKLSDAVDDKLWVVSKCELDILTIYLTQQSMELVFSEAEVPNF